MLRDLLSSDEWLVTESGFDPDQANVYETLFTVGNGFLGTRGTLEEGHRGELSGTYLCGVYDSHDAAVIDLVNAPDWLPFAVLVDGVRLGVQTAKVVDHERALDLRHGILWRRTVFEDAAGHRTELESVRLASMSDRELCAMRVAITPLNHNSPITIESAIEGYRRNLDRLPVYVDTPEFTREVKWEKWALSRHMTEIARDDLDDAIYLEMETIDSKIRIGYAAAVVASQLPERRSVRQSYERIEKRADFSVSSGETLVVDKIVSIATSRNHDDVKASALASLSSHREHGFEECLSESQAAWDALWQDCDCTVVGDDKATHALRFSIYQLLIAANPDDPRVNIGAKSMTGEGYRGHVFWDTECLMLPFYIYAQPQTAKTLLEYRYNTIGGAREYAVETGFKGARYPWEAADTGREECPMWTNDGAHRFWTRDEEIHVSADVSYGVVTYVAATGDRQFLLDYGAEILFDTSRFWVSRTTKNDDGSYSLNQVMGPDEFHSHIDDNAFTNRLAQWNLVEAAKVYEDLAANDAEALATILEKVSVTPEEVEEWKTVASKIRYHLDPENHVLEQFAGYFERLDVPVTEWDENNMPKYPVGYHHFNCEETMLNKQPDVVMLMHMLPDEFSPEVKKANYEFYEARTLHKSSLSPAIHAIMGIEVGDPERAVQYFFRSALVDLANNQGNTQDGVHIASAGGTWQILVGGFGGFRVLHDKMSFDPWLPEEWEGVRFRLQWRGSKVDVAVDHGEATFTLHGDADATEDILVAGNPVTLVSGQPQSVRLGETTAEAAELAESSTTSN